MTNVLPAVLKFWLSPGEIEALRGFLAERKIASHHRKGLAQIRSQGLNQPAKLNLGCGPHKKVGFLNIDLLPPADLTLDLRRGLPFETSCCDLIFSEHFFEHIDYPEPISHLFRECLRVLKPGARLLFNVPGTEWPLSDYRDGPDAPYFLACHEHKWHTTDCTTRLEHINYHFRQGTEHRYAYDFETAQKVLTGAGFTDVRLREYDPRLDSAHRRVNGLFVSATKPS
jgi:predicted SAM-dependent methyltransferase